ncbi:MAG: RecB family exonuclease, partial [Elusimicrobiales bacterium]
MSDYLQESIFSYKPQEKIKTESQADKSLAFSYSKMSMYKECPLKYKFKYVDKLAEKPKKFFFIGRVIHKVLEYFFSKLPPPSFEELKGIAQKEWRAVPYYDKGYANQEYEEIDLIKIIEIIANFHKKHSDNKALPFLLEYSTYVTINGYRFTIVADKIEYHSNGKITIVDYKTGKEENRTPDQLYFYQKVCESDPLIIKKIEEKYYEKVEKIEVKDMIYYYVENLKEIRYPRARESEIERFWDEVIATIENINSAKFDPKPSEKVCRWCDFKNRCPV